MVVLDLRVALFVLLVILVLILFLAIWLDRRFWRSRPTLPLTSITDSSESRVRPFLNDLAHELRTPLAVLLTHLEIQRSPTVPSETKQASIRLMQAEARRMSQMVSNILELGELETQGISMRRPVNLHALASDVVAEQGPRAAECDITLRIEAPATQIWVLGDEFRLKQVFINLIDNALKYSRPQDGVTISLERALAKQQIICIVQDTGPGIAIEHLPHLTRRFYRATSEQTSGSGLGLALVDTILRLHESQLEIESNMSGAETGTRARFVLALAVDMENQT